MGLLDRLVRFLESNNNNVDYENKNNRNEVLYADGSTIDEDEKSYYQPDDYYTMES